MRLAVIPARGGSKRIPRKNIKMFFNKPMIYRSIEAAQKSGVFDQVIVSTDDPEIATVACEAGAEVPFMRPSELADDFTPTIPVIQHAIEAMTALGQKPQQVCCLYATAPFVTGQDLLRGLERLQQGDCSYVFPVTNFAFPIQRALHRSEDGKVGMFNPETFNTRSQDLEEAWHDAGQFYWATAETWLKGEPVFGADANSIVYPRSRVQDIDTLEDWAHAELLFQVMVQTGAL